MIFGFNIYCLKKGNKICVFLLLRFIEEKKFRKKDVGKIFCKSNERD